MPQLRIVLLLLTLILSGTFSIWAQLEEGSASEPYTSLLSKCENKDPSPTSMSTTIPPNLQATERKIRNQLQTNPRDVMTQLRLARIFEFKRDFSAALIGYQEALRINRSCENCLIGLASLLSHCKQKSDAIRLTEEFLDRSPGSVMATRQLALLNLEQKNYLEVIRIAQKIQKLDRNLATGYQVQAMAHLALGQEEEAVDYFKTALENDESLAEVHLQLGMIYRKKPETVDFAARHLRKTLELGIVHPEIYKDLARMLLDKSQNKETILEAIEELHKALDMTSGYPEAYKLLSRAYKKLGNTTLAEIATKHFEKLVRNYQNAGKSISQAESHYENALKLLKEIKSDEARDTLRKVIRLNPDMDSAYYMLAMLDSMESRQREAVNWVRKAIQINPVRPRYYLLLGENLPRTETADAIEAVNKAILLNPSEASAYNIRGNIQFNDGQNESAVKSYRLAIRIDAENPVFHINLSSVLQRLGDEEGSRRERNIYLRLSALQDN